ncbi:hypothetical protein HZS_938 [Henneguya salminicola]|nr:hypothetical protein HZS_938 [Henneguya salminicola]
MMVDNIDPFNQLQWLVQSLLTAEEKGEKVHIIMHHPPGSGDCNSIWSTNFNRIMSRFKNMVTGIFCGHTHDNSFQLRFDPQTSEFEQVVIIGPSITPFVEVNPAFNVYELDDSANSSYYVVNSAMYFMDINDKNPSWKVQSNLPKDYAMRNLSSAEYVNLVDRMLYNDDLYERFMLLDYKY